MFKLVIHIYEYGNRGNGYEIHCGDHMYPNYMYNRFQVQYGASNSPLTVRYGNDGSTGCIWIGNLDTTWSYPQIWVSEFMIGYSNTSWATWRSGWSITLDSASFGNSGAMDGPYTCEFGYAATANYAATSGNSATTSQRSFDYIYATSYLESAGAVYGTIFYDNNDRSYYVDPNSTSKLVQINLGTTNTRLVSDEATGYIKLYGSASNYLGIGPYNNNGWLYFENIGNSNGVYFNSPGRYAFDSVDVTPYTDAENSLGNGSYRWANVYTSGWLRQYGAQGMYNQDYGTHFYSLSSGAWAITGSGGAVELQFRSNHQSTVRGYVYADTSNNIGFLNNGGNWSLRTDSNRNTEIYGNLTLSGSVYQGLSNQGVISLLSDVVVGQTNNYFRLYLPQGYVDNRNGGTATIKIVWGMLHAGITYSQEYKLTFGTNHSVGGNYLIVSDVTRTYKDQNPDSYGGYLMDQTPAVDFYQDTSGGYINFNVKGYQNYNTHRVVAVDIVGGGVGTPTLTYYGASSPGGTALTVKDIPYATTAGALSSMNISQFSNNSGYLTGITSGQVTSALGYTPYNSSNPSGYVNNAFAGDMNQNVRTTDAPTFDYINTTMPNKSFNPFGGAKMHDAVLTNMMAGKWDRFDVTINGVLEPNAAFHLSNQNYEEYNAANLYGTDAGETKVYNINFQKLDGYFNSNGVTYSAGFFDLNFYSSPFPASWSCRARNRDGVWTNVTLTKIGASLLRGVSPHGNWLTDIEYTLTARTGAPYVTGNITYGISEFEFFGSRIALSQGAVISAVGGYMSGVLSTKNGNSNNWNTAYGWGNHASAGYLTSSSLSGYATQSWVNSQGFLTSVSDIWVNTSGDTMSGHLNVSYNIASPSNYYSGLQAEIMATSGTAGIALHRSGYSHVGIYHDSTNELKFNFNGGTPILPATAGTLWGSGNLTNLNQLTNGPGYVTSSGSVNYATTAGSAPNGGNINSNYDVTAGTGNGLRFWNGDSAYKISMGVGSLYQYGPVTDYSIKMQMNNGDTARGFTWGRESHAPIAALNSTSGDLQIAGSLRAAGHLFTSYNGNNILLRSADAGGDAGILVQNSSGSFKFQIYGNGGDYGFLNGNWAGWDIRKTIGGVMYMNNNNSYYIQTDSTSNFYALNIQGNAVVHAGNIGSQSVSYATTAGSADQIDGWGFVNTGSNVGTNADTINSNGISYVAGGISLLGQTDGALYSQRYSDSWQHQIYGDYRTGQIVVRGKNSGSWTSWRTIIDSSTIGSQSVSYASSAGSVAWTNVSSRPTALSQFTNDLGNYGGWITSSGSISGNAATATSATYLNSSNYISQRGSNGSWNADFTSTAAGTMSYGGDLGANGTNGPGGSWWIQQNFRHTNSSNYWGTQVAWGWEDNANRLATRNITGGSYGAWVYYLNSSNFTSYAPSLTGSGASGTWGISVTGNAATVGGYAVSAGVGANTVVIREGNGYAFFNYINSNVSETENPTINSFYTSNGDGYFRKSTVAHVKSQLGLGSLAYSSATIPTNNNQLTNGAGYITGINSGNVTTALGFTPYNATNPSGYITSSASISGNAATATNVAWTGVTGRPTALSQFSNDLGNYGGFLTSLPAHDHDRLFLTDSRGASRAPSYYDQRYAQWDFQNNGDTGAGGDSWHGLLTVAKWFSYDASHRQEQLAFTGDDLKRRTATSDSAWGSWKTIIDTGNVGSQSVSYANSAGSATTAGSATSASQLNKYGDIYGQDWNTYYVQDKLIAAAVYGHSGANRPNLTYDYGVALSYGESTGPRMQMYFPENSPNLGTIFRKATYRTGWNGNWSTWKTLVEQEGNTCTIVGGVGAGLEVHGNPGYNQDPLTYFLLRGAADTSWKAFKVRLTGDAGGQDIEFRRIAENGADSRMWYVPRGGNTVNFDYPIVQPSDSRLKDNITPISTPVDKIKSLRGVEFDWNSGEQVGTHDVGLIAQDVEAVLPEAVTTQEDGYKNLAYTKVIPLLVEAMKEQQAMIEALKAEIELLKNK